MATAIVYAIDHVDVSTTNLFQVRFSGMLVGKAIERFSGQVQLTGNELPIDITNAIRAEAKQLCAKIDPGTATVIMLVQAIL